MADAIQRYQSLQENIAAQRKKVDDARGGWTQAFQNAPVGKEGMNQRGGALRDYAAARGELNRLTDQNVIAKGDMDRFNIQLMGANQRIFNEANAANRNAALQEQAAALEAPPEQGTSDTATQANNQAFETATPGGTSGRRRRNPVEVGSIRI